jgi:TolB-like protein/Tfp pilus assembly protein PilF
MSLYRELKRRNVIRVGIAYLALSWLVAEVSGTLFPVFGIPDWGIRFLVIVFALGFVPALIISWVYEITPEGLKREADVVRDDSITHVTAKRLDMFTIGLIVVALGFILADRLWLSPRHLEQIAAPADVVTDTVQTPEPEPEYPPNSIAVLPFANRSANPDDAYFVDGIHDDLLTHISKIGSIKTISRTSVMRYRGSSKSIPEIAAELGVATVLEGGVQRAGDQVRINVQLIDARSDEHLWAEIYDRRLTASNIFTIQTEIAESIASKLKVVLSPLERSGVENAPTENLEAYDAYLFGKKRLSERTAESLAEAIHRFDKAIRLDPDFALAWIGLANARWLYNFYGEETDGASDDLQAARNALKTALELDPSAGEAYATLATLEQDDEVAERHFRRAIELRPNYASAYQWYSMLLRNTGRIDEALNLIQTAVQLDPMSAVIKLNLVVVLRKLGRFDEAWEELHKMIAIDPEYVPARDAIATMQFQIFNRYDLAVKEYDRIFAIRPKETGWYVWLAQLYLDLNAPDRAAKLITIRNESTPGGETSAWGNLLLGLQRHSTENLEEDAQLILKGLSFDRGTWNSQFAASQLRNQAMREGRLDDARGVYAQYYPQLLLESEPTINTGNYRAAIDLALVLQRTGDSARAELLLQLCAEFIGGRPRLGVWGGSWISDVQILALQGRSTEALDALRLAVDEGWRSLWWYYLQYDPNLNSIRGEPEFQIVVAEIRADMASQMQRIREMEQSGEIRPVPGVVIEPK